MTILKKLSIAIVLALGVQLSTGAFFIDEHRFKNEKALILNFAQDLRNQNSSQAQKIAQWLDQEVITGSRYHSSIINIITNNDLTEKSKITLFSELIAQQKSDNRKQFINDICAGILCIGMFSALGWLIIEEAKRPIIYRRPRPGVTVTYTSTSWPCISTSWSQTISVISPPVIRGWLINCEQSKGLPERLVSHFKY